ncbi:MAG: T9SS type A sorting domain-containing protein [Ignavibacteria bacterium]|nr:T9SS type A sorting domain-containing protein [Ignavibacteria bacterium]
MDWLNASTGYMASINGTIFKSTNAGANWSLLNDTTGLSGVDVIDIEVIDTGRGFAVGEQGKLFKQFSQNQWVVERSLTTAFGSEENLWGIDFVSTSSGFMCGYYGTVYKIDAAVITAVPNTGLPLVYSLGQNYPNPFNPATVIKFSVPEASQVTMKVYDVLGKELFVLVNSKMQSGSYEVSFNASQLPSGVYFYKMEAGSFSETRKMMLIK